MDVIDQADDLGESVFSPISDRPLDVVVAALQSLGGNIKATVGSTGEGMRAACLILLFLWGCAHAAHPLAATSRTTANTPTSAVTHGPTPQDILDAADRAAANEEWAKAASMYQRAFADSSINEIYDFVWESSYERYIVALLKLGKTSQARARFAALYHHQRSRIAHPIPYPAASALVMRGEYRKAFQKYATDMYGPVRGDNTGYNYEQYADTGADAELHRGLDYAVSGHYNQALEAWRRAVYDSGYFQEPHYLSAVAYLALGKRKAALSEFIAVTQGADFSFIGEARPAPLDLGALNMIFTVVFPKGHAARHALLTDRVIAWKRFVWGSRRDR